MSWSDAARKAALEARRRHGGSRGGVKKVHFLAERDPTGYYPGGGLTYRTGGVGYSSIKHLKSAYPKGTVFARIKASKKNRLFG